MGIGQAMSSGMKKNMQAQMAFQKQLILRQRQAQMATQIAMGRERFKYYSSFVYTLAPLLAIGAYVNKKPALLGPLIPLSFAYAYQYDMLYGDMFQRVQIQADKMICENPQKFYLPKHSGIASKEEYEEIIGISSTGQKILT